MKRFALPSIFGGFVVAFFVTVIGGGVTGIMSREDWFTGRIDMLALALVGVFVVLWIAATFVIDYCLARQSDEED